MAEDVDAGACVREGYLGKRGQAPLVYEVVFRPFSELGRNFPGGNYRDRHQPTSPDPFGPMLEAKDARTRVRQGCGSKWGSAPTPNQKANRAQKFPYAGPEIQLRSTLNPLRSTLETTDASLGGSSKRGLQCGFTCNGRFVLFLAQMLFCSAWDAETFR